MEENINIVPLEAVDEINAEMNTAHEYVVRLLDRIRTSTKLQLEVIIVDHTLRIIPSIEYIAPNTKEQIIARVRNKIATNLIPFCCSIVSAYQNRIIRILKSKPNVIASYVVANEALDILLASMSTQNDAIST